MTTPDGTRTRRTATGSRDEPTLMRAGRSAWAVLGILGVLAVAGLLAARVALVLMPVVFALFPAALLAPATAWLKQRGLPPPAAASASLGATLAVLAAAVALIVPALAGELPRLVASANQGLAELQAALARLPGIDADSLPELFARARDAVAQTGQLTQPLVAVAVALAEGALVPVLGLIALFFYLTDGRRLLSPSAARRHRRRCPHRPGAVAAADPPRPARRYGRPAAPLRVDAAAPDPAPSRQPGGDPHAV
jgi:putative heme transporter